MKKSAENVPSSPISLSADLRPTFRYITQTQRRLKGIFDSSIAPTAQRALRRNTTYPSFTETRNALRAGNPEPFFKLLELMPTLLLEEEYWNLSVGKWVAEKVHSKQARTYLVRVGHALAAIGSGNVKVTATETRRKQGQIRKREYDDRVRLAREAIRTDIHAALTVLPSALRKSTPPSRKARRQVEDRIIQDALTSTDPAMKKAAQLEYRRLERERLQIPRW